MMPPSLRVGGKSDVHDHDVGEDQVRGVTIAGEHLSIVASDRTSADGRTFHGELVWLRV